MKQIAVLGSTGSIGTTALKILSKLDNYKVLALTANRNLSLLKKQIIEHQPKYIAIFDNKSADRFCDKEKDLIKKYNLEVYKGLDGLKQIACLPELDIVLVSVVGAVGLKPLMSAINAGHTVAIANKEPLVIAGKLIIKQAKKSGSVLIPVDSEHSAIFQCLNGENISNVRRILITASGGPFYNADKDKLKNVRVADALNHPRWNMGKKITIDSATLMNKGLEVIEAHHLFNIDFEQIEIIIHPQSIIHSMVEFCDGSIMAHMGTTDMHIPIQFALTYPDRSCSRVEKVDFTKMNTLNFSVPDIEKFPCLKMALYAGKQGESVPVVLNAANETAVNMFIREEISFCAIPEVISKVMDKHTKTIVNSIDDILEIDKWARLAAKEIKTKC
ncbi:1-deoxy-D-xylulose-5-phosphate reductoisomerase [bacterium]